MFCAYDEDENVIAFHDNKKVVEKYILDVYRANKVNLSLGKIKTASEYKLEGKDDLYLVRFNKTYVQSGYLIYIQIAAQQFVDDEEFVKDILLRMLEVQRLTKKQEKTIQKAVGVIDELLDEDARFVPTLSQLKSMKMDYDPYIYNYGLIEKW